jgi:hypothetical protein
MAKKTTNSSEVPEDFLGPEMQAAIAHASLIFADSSPFFKLRTQIQFVFRKNDPKPYPIICFPNVDAEMASFKSRKKHQKTKLAGGILRELLIKRDFEEARKTQTRMKAAQCVAAKWGGRMSAHTVINIAKEVRYRDSLKPFEQRTNARRAKKKLIPYVGKKR